MGGLLAGWEFYLRLFPWGGETKKESWEPPPHFGGHVAALVRCVLIGRECISLIKSCHIRRRNECIKVKGH